MTTQEIADRLVKGCRTGAWEKVQQELYADDVVSREPYATPDFEQETKGLKAIVEKGKKFESMIDTVHSLNVSDPIVAENSFACILDMDVTMKQKGRMHMKEICLYKVKDGKIVEEEFIV